MPIKEGEVSNTFLSHDTYISVAVNDGNEEKTPVHRKILLSALGNNSYNYKTDFRGTPVVVKLTDYIPNATSVFEESKNGEKYLLFVESGGGGRHDHYIKKGTSQVVHGVSVGYDAPERSTINFKTVDGSLKILSAVNGSFYRMSDKFDGFIVKDSLQDLSLLSVHSVAGLKFVIPKGPVQGSYETIAGDKDQNSLAQLEFDVSVGNESKHIILRGGKLSIQSPTTFTIDNLNFRMSYGAMQLQLPFSIKLNDFQLEKYPGSNSPMSFASEVTVIDPNETFDFRIFMNNILNYKGFKFFQSSYSITPQYEQTFLSVTFDFGAQPSPISVIPYCIWI